MRGKEQSQGRALPRDGAQQRFCTLYGSVPPTPVLGTNGKARPPGGREGAARRRKRLDSGPRCGKWLLQVHWRARWKDWGRTGRLFQFLAKILQATVKAGDIDIAFGKLIEVYARLAKEALRNTRGDEG